MKNLVYVDDEPKVLELVRVALESKGCRVFVTLHVDEFFRIMEEKPIDLVLLDIRMPECNGLDLFQDLRKWRHLPVLFITGYPESFSLRLPSLVDLWKREFAKGNTEVLYKPFNISMLVAKVESLIGPLGETSP